MYRFEAVSRPLCLPSGCHRRSRHFARPQRGRQAFWSASTPPSSPDRSVSRKMHHPTSSPRSTQPEPASPVPGVSLSSVHIAEAQQKSTDNGATLNLSYTNIRQIDEELAQELAALGWSNLKEDVPNPLARCVLSNPTYVFLT